MTIKTDPKFQNAIPPLTEEEYNHTVEYAAGLLMRYSNNGQERLIYVDAKEVEKQRKKREKMAKNSRTAIAVRKYSPALQMIKDGATYEEALQYVNSVKASGHYNVVFEDAAIDGKTISFKADSDDKAESTEGYSGYICPSYAISFTDLLGTTTLTIKFGVGYTTYV